MRSPVPGPARRLPTIAVTALVLLLGRVLAPVRGAPAPRVLEHPSTGPESKLAGSLQTLVLESRTREPATVCELARSLGLATSGPRILVRMTLIADGSHQIPSFEARGARVRAIHGPLVEAWVLPADLPDLASIPLVEKIRPPFWGVLSEGRPGPTPTDREGVPAAAGSGHARPVRGNATGGGRSIGRRGASRADAGLGRARAESGTWGGKTPPIPPGEPAGVGAAGLTGRGCKVGLIGVGFEGLEPGPRGEGGVILHGATGTGDHGTASVEALRALAPGATIHAYGLVGFPIDPGRPGEGIRVTDVEYMEALAQLTRLEVTVLSSSIGFDNLGPLDAKSFLTHAAQVAGLRGLFVQAAGDGARRQHRGVFADGDGDGLHEFGMSSRDADHIEIPTLPGIRSPGDGSLTWQDVEVLPVLLDRDRVTISLSWDDWRPSSLRPHPENDLDLIVVLPGEGTLVTSAELQGGPEARIACPFESCLLRVQDRAREPMALVLVRRSRGQGPVAFRIMVEGARIAPAWQTPERSLAHPADAPILVTVGTWDGASRTLDPSASRGSTDGGSDKPDFVVATGSSPATGAPAGAPPAVTPRVAGAAALLMEWDPEMYPFESREELVRRARPLPGRSAAEVGAGLFDPEAVLQEPGPGTEGHVAAPFRDRSGSRSSSDPPPARRPQRPPPPPERPLRILVESPDPAARFQLRFTSPAGLESSSDRTGTWSSLWHENPRFLREGHRQIIEVSGLDGGSRYHPWVLAPAGSTGKPFPVVMMITTPDGRSTLFRGELAPGRLWKPAVIEGLTGPAVGAVEPADPGSTPSIPGREDLGEVWLELRGPAGWAPLEPGTPPPAGARVRIGLDLEQPAHVWLAAVGSTGSPRILTATGSTRDGSWPGDGVVLSDTDPDRFLLLLSDGDLPGIPAPGQPVPADSILGAIARGDPGWDDTLALVRTGEAPASRSRILALSSESIRWAVLAIDRGTR